MKHLTHKQVLSILIALMLAGFVMLLSSDSIRSFISPDLPPVSPLNDDIDHNTLYAKIKQKKADSEFEDSEDSDKPEHPALLEQFEKDKFMGDLDQIRERGILRVLISVGRTNFFFSRNKIRGFEFELMREFESHLNQTLEPGQNRIQVFYIPVPFDEIVDRLAQGLGDVAAAGLTVTPERTEKIQFTRPYIKDINEVVVLHKDVDNVQTLEDLCERQVYVRPGSSYVAHLKKLSAGFVTRDLPPIHVVEGDPSLTTDDILELTNAGIIKITVADNHIAEIWSKILPDITVREDLAINTGGKISWAVRKDSPQLLEQLNAFLRTHRKGTLMGNIFYERYFERTRYIKNPFTKRDRQRLEPMTTLFRKYGREYGFDWMALAAQAYQESGFDNSKISDKGAVGVMQVLPTTAADKNVNIPDIVDLENNIHAGTKYLSFLRRQYFDTPEISPADQIFFAWAAYNAGPGRINQLRRRARQNGLDPNKWFFNVEKMASQAIGRETVEYVAKINKYYVAFRLGYERS